MKWLIILLLLSGVIAVLIGVKYLRDTNELLMIIHERDVIITDLKNQLGVFYHPPRKEKRKDGEK